MKISRAEYIHEFGPKTDFIHLASAVTAAIFAAVLGSYVVGLAMMRFGSAGSIALWGLGAATGFIVTRFIARGEGLAWLLATSIVLAMLLGQIHWVRWNSVGYGSWSNAAAGLGVYFRLYSTESLIALIFAIGGAMSAFRQAAR